MPDVDLLDAAFVINLLIPLFLIYLFIFGNTSIGYNIPLAWEITRLHNICIAPQLTMLSFNVHFWCHFYSSTKMVVQGCTSNALSGSDISLRSAITDVLPLAWPGLFLMMIESSVRKMQFFEIFLGFFCRQLDVNSLTPLGFPSNLLFSTHSWRFAHLSHPPGWRSHDDVYVTLMTWSVHVGQANGWRILNFWLCHLNDKNHCLYEYNYDFDLFWNWLDFKHSNGNISGTAWDIFTK